MEMMAVTMEQDKLPDPFSLTFQDHSIKFSGNHPSPPQPPPFHRHQALKLPQFKTSFKLESVQAMREVIFQMAVLQPPVHIDLESVKPPKRRNVKTSKDPQSVAARHRRERISEKIRILPGGTKMDTASMLEEAVHYMKFLKKASAVITTGGRCRSAGGMAAEVKIEVDGDGLMVNGDLIISYVSLNWNEF